MTNPRQQIQLSIISMRRRHAIPQFSSLTGPSGAFRYQAMGEHLEAFQDMNPKAKALTVLYVPYWLGSGGALWSPRSPCPHRWRELLRAHPLPWPHRCPHSPLWSWLWSPRQPCTATGPHRCQHSSLAHGHRWRHLAARQPCCSTLVQLN